MRFRVEWWWYVIVLFLLGLALAAIVSCGGDDFTEDDYDWFRATSPSGVKLECLGYGEGLWCREVVGG